jgi:hypothetical protein
MLIAVALFVWSHAMHREMNGDQEDEPLLDKSGEEQPAITHTVHALSIHRAPVHSSRCDITVACARILHCTRALVSL